MTKSRRFSLMTITKISKYEEEEEEEDNDTNNNKMVSTSRNSFPFRDPFVLHERKEFSGW